MEKDFVIRNMEAKIKLKGDTQLNFYYNKVKEEFRKLEEENKRLREELKDKR